MERGGHERPRRKDRRTKETKKERDPPSYILQRDEYLFVRPQFALIIYMLCLSVCLLEVNFFIYAPTPGVVSRISALAFSSHFNFHLHVESSSQGVARAVGSCKTLLL